MPVIDAARVQRWTQDPPAVTRGEALFSVDAECLVAVPVSGTADVAFAAAFLAVVPQDGDAQVAADTVIGIRPALIGEASAAIESSAETIDVAETACIAIVEITATATIKVPLAGEALVSVLDESQFVPTLLGSAEVEFADYGQGSVPLFPFTLPAQFTDNPLGIQTAEAVIVINGFSDDVAVAGFADAVVRIVDQGSTFPYYFPILFEGLIGNTPIFPFLFPVVFTAEANVYSALATITVEADADTVVSVFADAEAAITSTASNANPGFFPLTFPVTLRGFTASGDAVLAFTSGEDPTIFPFELPALFGDGTADVKVVVAGLAAIDIYTPFIATAS